MRISNKGLWSEISLFRLCCEGDTTCEPPRHHAFWVRIVFVSVCKKKCTQTTSSIQSLKEPRILLGKNQLVPCTQARKRPSIKEAHVCSRTFGKLFPKMAASRVLWERKHSQRSDNCPLYDVFSCWKVFNKWCVFSPVSPLRKWDMQQLCQGLQSCSSFVNSVATFFSAFAKTRRLSSICIFIQNTCLVCWKACRMLFSIGRKAHPRMLQSTTSREGLICMGSVLSWFAQLLDCLIVVLQHAFPSINHLLHEKYSDKNANSNSSHLLHMTTKSNSLSGSKNSKKKTKTVFC